MILILAMGTQDLVGCFNSQLYIRTTEPTIAWERKYGTFCHILWSVHPLILHFWCKINSQGASGTLINFFDKGPIFGQPLIQETPAARDPLRKQDDFI